MEEKSAGSRITNGQVFAEFAKQLKQYRWSFTLIVLFIVVSEIFGMIAPLFYKDFFDVLSQDGAGSTLRRILLIILGFHLSHWFLSRLAGFIRTYTEVQVVANLQQSTFNYIIGHSHTFFSNHFIGSLVRKIRRISDSYSVVSDNILWTFLPTTTVIIAAIVLLAQRSVLISGILLLWVVVFVAASYYTAIKKLPYDLARSNEDSATTAAIADSLTNNVTVNLFSGQKFEQTLVQHALAKWRKAALFTWFLSDGIEAGQWILMTLLEFLVMWFAVRYWQQGLLTIGDFALIQSYLISIFIRVWDLGRTIRKTYEAIADAKETVELITIPHEIQDRPLAKPLKVSKGAITFGAVKFWYHRERPILNNLSLSIKPKEKVAFVGPSGAGKSTLIKLILRLHDIQKGTIQIDGQDIKKITQESLHQAIAMVPQEAVLFHRSILDNIRYGRMGATDDEVVAAAKQAHCHEFISQLPDGYQTFVGERGVKLSGGERQRVAIARAILKNAPILILDEATSSLDSESEQLIQHALFELMKNRTTIVIAHRLSTILKMDRIVVIDDGKVVDQGTHGKLTQKVGIYKKLWDIQAGGFEGK